MLRLIVITNLEDHFTFIYNFNTDLASNAFREMSYILQLLEKKSSGFVFDNEIGFTTENPLHNGSGAEIAYYLNLQASFDSIQSKVPR